MLPIGKKLCGKIVICDGYAVGKFSFHPLLSCEEEETENSCVGHIETKILISIMMPSLIPNIEPFSFHFHLTFFIVGILQK